MSLAENEMFYLFPLTTASKPGFGNLVYKMMNPVVTVYECTPIVTQEETLWLLNFLEEPQENSPLGLSLPLGQGSTGTVLYMGTAASCSRPQFP